MLSVASQLLRFAIWCWPLWLWLLAWSWAGTLALDTVYYRTAKVAGAAALFVPALFLAVARVAPAKTAILAAAGSILAGCLGFASEYARVWPSFALSGYSLSYIAPYLDYPLLVTSALAIVGPLLVPLLRGWSYVASGQRTNGLLGSARWMGWREARRIFGTGDLVVGEASVPAVAAFLQGRAPLLRFDGSSHLLTVAGSNSGKTTSVAIPNCLLWQGGLVAHDPKGELARLCGPARRAMGREVFVLDPADARSDSLNVLEWLDPASRRLIDDARSLVSWLTNGEPSAGENKTFEENARELILTLLLIVVADSRIPPERRTLAQVRDYFYVPNLREALEQIGTNRQDIAFGVAAQNARVFQSFGERFWGGILGTAKDLLNCISSPAMADLVSGTGQGRRLSLAEFAAGKIDVFVSIPVKDLDANPAIARLLLGTLLNAAYEAGREGGGQGRRTLFLLDEMPRLRYMTLLETARDIGRGMGITLWAIVQDLGQLEKHYGKEGVVSWLENSHIKSFFGVSEYSTAELISKTIGEHTITTRSRSWTHFADLFAAKSDQPQARLLITPDEIMRMATDARGLPDEQIVLLRSHPPLRCGLAKYYRRKELVRLVGG
jgi:type IV secretion system protein VirD4